ncbi:hypothetical protein Dred_2920 [Desulforamulus reducens MI-1]|uniref:Uncharacterized protein n=1 Tax=Desulforamulus reducens (strain ATCC BAA-1160 / DSM 100696 / MI-1) TaxID=349161 RepID=A4J8M1_DESRM|nr:hypothetical protein [Desulforamulus reducens]ABO51424.1 hypothetical protein Dred_2920 [Desulforamulus reducens MI-1]
MTKDEKELTEATEDTVSSTSFIKRRGLLKEFEAFTLEPSNTSGAISLPLNTTPTTIASLTGENVLCIDDECDRVCLTCTVGWEAISNANGEGRQADKVDVLFKIFRGNPMAGEMIFSCRQSANATEENFQTTTFTHVDLPFAKKVHNPCEDDLCHCAPTVPYFVTAELPVGGQANVIGPITFTGSQIAQNPR